VTLWLVRHAQPLVEAGICYGALDLAADPAATTRTARALAEALPAGIVLRSSPLQRCTRLAKALLALRADLSLQTDARLAEMNFGRWEGRAWDALPRAELDAWTADFAHYRAGGLGESVHQVMERVGQALDDARCSGRDQVWITHGGVVKAASLLARGVCRVENPCDWPSQGLSWGQWCQMEPGPGQPVPRAGPPAAQRGPPPPLPSQPPPARPR